MHEPTRMRSKYTHRPLNSMLFSNLLSRIEHTTTNTAPVAAAGFADAVGAAAFAGVGVGVVVATAILRLPLLHHRLAVVVEADGGMHVRAIRRAMLLYHNENSSRRRSQLVATARVRVMRTIRAQRSCSRWPAPHSLHWATPAVTIAAM